MKTLTELKMSTYLTDPVKWELLKYEICKFAVNFSKKLAQNSRKLQRDLETEIKNLVQNINNEDKFNEYKTVKGELEIRSKCNWYQYGEKSTKYFLNLEKQKAVNGTVKKIIKNDIEITDQLKIQHELKMFYEQLFKKTICNANSKIVSFLDNISLSVINNDFFNLCENDLTGY